MDSTRVSGALMSLCWSRFLSFFFLKFFFFLLMHFNACLQRGALPCSPEKILPVEDSVDCKRETGSHKIHHKKDSHILDIHLQHKSAI